MENFRDKMREMFSTPNKTNSGRKVPFWGVGGLKYLQKPHWSVCGNDRHSKAYFMVGVCLQTGTGNRVEKQ